jgi:carboxymethylenebutenolidase
MPPITQDIINLYDRFTHGQMSRRDFMDTLTGVVGVGAVAGVLATLANDEARAQTIAATDPRIVSERVTFPGTRRRHGRSSCPPRWRRSFPCRDCDP